MAELVVVRMDDWEAVYIDGKLLEQNHSVDLGSVAEALGGEEHWREYDPDSFPGFPETVEEWRTWDAATDQDQYGETAGADVG